MNSKLCLVLAMVWAFSLPNTFAAETDLSKLAAANNTFAFKLLKQIADEKKGGNVFISPYSAATALQMAANGAGGKTKTEMQSALETSGLSDDALNAASKAAAGLLTSQDTNLILTTANALWHRPTAKIKPEYLEMNRNFFATSIKATDFSNAPVATAEINQWASDQTHGRITGLADGLIDPVWTDLVLVNAIYFKGKWLDRFDAKLTKDRPFHLVTGTIKNVPMMEMSSEFTYRKGSGYQAVRLPYVGGDLAMYVFLPDAGFSPTKLLRIMDGDKWHRVTVPGFHKHDGLVVLPKFKLDSTFDLKSPLQVLGMRTAFMERQANFSGMFHEQHYISKVLQKTFVEVGEAGTEATAATIIAQDFPASMPVNPPKPFQMIVDRPFLFAIVDARSEMILFMGVVNEL